jgi:hypothetical protein
VNSDVKLERLREILKPVIAWCEQWLADGEPDPSYLYDTTSEMCENWLSRGDYVEIIELLRERAA